MATSSLVENSMDSFELDIIDEKSRAGSDFMTRVASEIRRAFASEKAVRKITQQAVADKIGTSRAVINRQVQGLENLSARRIGELLWAIGWEPTFAAQRIPAGENQAPPVRYVGGSATVTLTTQGSVSITPMRSKNLNSESGLDKS